MPETITLLKLHMMVQAAFGWSHSHLHEFIGRDGQRYGTSDPDYDAPGEVASERIRFTTALAGGRTLRYMYDFGDSWDHRIKLEKTFAPGSADQAAAVHRRRWCDAARGLRRIAWLRGLPAGHDQSPPPGAREHDRMAWPRQLDPNAFDVADVNDWLAEIKV